MKLMNDPQDLGVAVASEKREKTKNEDMGIQFGMSPIPFHSLCVSKTGAGSFFFSFVLLYFLGPFSFFNTHPLSTYVVSRLFMSFIAPG